jgi:chitinase
MQARLSSVWALLLLIASACAADISLERRANCRTITVVSGDGCGSLASRCKITAANFTKFNPGANFCSTLVPGQQVCCSAGTLPSKAPKPNADGTCFAYTIKSGDSCAGLAATYTLTVAKIESFNQQNYGRFLHISP